MITGFICPLRDLVRFTNEVLLQSGTKDLAKFMYPQNAIQMMKYGLEELEQKCEVLSEASWKMPLNIYDKNDTRQLATRRMQSQFKFLQRQTDEVRRDMHVPVQPVSVAGQQKLHMALLDGLSLGLQVLRNSNTELPQNAHVKSCIVDAQIATRRLLKSMVEYLEDNFGTLEQLVCNKSSTQNALPKSNFSFRWTLRKDYQSIIEISKKSHHPVTEDKLIQISKTPYDYLFVATIEEAIAGYSVQRVRTRTIDLLHSGTHDQYVDQGIRREIHTHIANKTRFSRTRRARVPVSETDTDSIKLLTECGYRALGIIKDDSNRHRFLFHYSAPAEEKDIAQIRDATQE